MSIKGLILTDNVRFARMLEHEMSYMRISLDTASDEESVLAYDDFRVVLADLDFCGSGILSALLEGKETVDLANNAHASNDGAVLVIGWSKTEAPEYFKDFYKCSAFMHRPFLMGDLRYMISRYFSLENKAFEDISTNDRLSSYLSYISRLRTISEMKDKDKADNRERILSVDKESMVACYGEMKFLLSEYEYKTLSLLCDNRGRVVSRGEIARVLDFDSGNMGDVYICHLRKKIDNSLGLKLITTVRGKGYMVK